MPPVVPAGSAEQAEDSLPQLAHARVLRDKGSVALSVPVAPLGVLRGPMPPASAARSKGAEAALEVAMGA